MKKILGLMIVISMFMLAGCSGRHVPSENSSKNPKQKLSLQKKQIQMMICMVRGEPVPYQQMVSGLPWSRSKPWETKMPLISY